jgi:hypothetical protein
VIKFELLCVGRFVWVNDDWNEILWTTFCTDTPTISNCTEIRSVFSVIKHAEIERACPPLQRTRNKTSGAVVLVSLRCSYVRDCCYDRWSNWQAEKREQQASGTECYRTTATHVTQAAARSVTALLPHTWCRQRNGVFLHYCHTCDAGRGTECYCTTATHVMQAAERSVTALLPHVMQAVARSVTALLPTHVMQAVARNVTALLPHMWCRQRHEVLVHYCHTCDAGSGTECYCTTATRDAGSGTECYCTTATHVMQAAERSVTALLPHMWCRQRHGVLLHYCHICAAAITNVRGWVKWKP